MKHLESLESTQVKLQGDRPSPETPRGSLSNLRVPARVNDVESYTMCSKNSAFDYFDGAAWTPRLRSPSSIMAPARTYFGWQCGAWSTQLSTGPREAHTAVGDPFLSPVPHTSWICFSVVYTVHHTRQI